VLTISSTRTEENDESGRAIESALQGAGVVQIERDIVKDDISLIKTALTDMASRCDAVLTTGGTGFSPSDVTPEATAGVIDRWAHSLVELVRLKAQEETAFACASRGIAGIAGSCVIVNLPGSPAGARHGAETLMPVIPHILSQVRGGGH
jgi:molybdenum cofactor synthesis domain-containing protein